MPDAARIAQAQALEVPLILQGARTADASGHRELFKENATTTLVFENGAVLNLRTKLTVGQAVFIHNEQNGREILCKVVEAPAEGEAGHTNLEFTTADPEFWNASALRSGASLPDPVVGAAKADTNAQPEAPGADDLAMMTESTSQIHLPNMVKPGKESGGSLREELVPAHEMVPNSEAAPSVPIPDFEPAATSAGNASEPTGEQIDAALKQMSGAAQAAPPLDGTEPEQDQKHLAALMERDARLAKFAAFKEKQADKIQRDFATKTASKAAPPGGTERDKEFEASSETPPIWAKATALDKLTTGKNATYLTIGIAALIVVAIGFLWHSMRGVFVQPSDAPVASAPAQPAANPATPATAPAVTASTPNAPQPVAAPAPKAAAVRTTAEIRTASSRDVARARAEAAAMADAARARSQTQDGANGAEIIPARILSQPQPTLPPWAKDMELDGVVTMDVTISERGSVAETKVLSGPRALQHEAERALSLWQFQPGQSGGKPAASHLTLSVEFLPPPPPKRFP